MKLDELDRYAPLFRSMEPSYGGLLRRRERKRRNQRIGAAVVAIVVMLALAGSFAVTYVGSQHVPAEGGLITPQNVGQLQLRWSADLDGAVPANLNASNFLPYPPTVAGDTVYIGTDAGTLYAFPGSCGTGGATCIPTWTAHVKGAVDHAVTAADGHIFASTDAGKLYAFPAGCATECEPEWVGDVGYQLYGSPVVADGKVYGIDLWNGRLYAFDEACQPSTPGGTCAPSWTAWLGSRLQDNLDCEVLASCVVAAPTVADGLVFAGGEGHRAGEALRAFDAVTGELRWKSPHASANFIRRYRWPVIVGDRVFVAWGDDVDAFPTRCGTGGATCDPVWWASTGFQGQPLVSGRQVVVGADAVYAYPIDCRADGGLCGPTWVSRQYGNLVGQPLGAGDGMVVVPDSGTSSGGIATIPMSPSGDRNRPALWRASVPYPFAPVVSNGVVYVGSGMNEVDAFPIDCHGQCSPSWSWSEYTGLSTPTVGTDAIFVAEQSGKLLSFGPGSGEGEGGSVIGSPALPLAVVGAVAVAVAVVLRRRRRVERLLEGA
jgi:outer membrane protein assembly factor BamB